MANRIVQHGLENNLISEVKLIDSNPANNPQPPKNNKV